jgi:hypothetical protein
MVGKEKGRSEKGKGRRGLALALFEAGVFLVDDVDATFPADDLAVRGAAFDGGANFHVLALKVGATARPGQGGKPGHDKSQR